MDTYASIQEGIVWAIIGLSAVALVVFLNRIYHLHRESIRVKDFLKGIVTVLNRGNIAEAVSICEETPGSAATIVRTAVLRHDRDPDVIRLAMDEAALIEIRRMERGTVFFSCVVHLAPLLGLLGTVAGLGHAFVEIQGGAPLVHVGVLAKPLWLALVTTAEGLVVAMLGIVAGSILSSRINALILDMDLAALDILGYITGTQTTFVEDDQAVEEPGDAAIAVVGK